MTSTFRALVALLVLTFTVTLGAAEPTIDQLLGGFPRSQLTIKTPDARAHRFNVWIASNDQHRMQGLMFVRELPPDAGMLFIYEQPQRIGMWMKNTYIPLDMVFIRADGRVAEIVANTTPHSLETVQSKEDVVAVLELNGGTAQKLNIRPGAIIDREALRLGARSRNAS